MKKIITAACVVLAGCATSYQPKGLTGGFSDLQLDNNVFQVSFRANAYTRAQDAQNMALLRSAEIAIQHGYRYFVIVQAASRARTESVALPAQSVTTANVSSFGNTATGSATTTSFGGQILNFSAPSTTDTIVCFTERPNVAGMVYNAQFVADSLRKQYVKAQ